MGLHRKHLHIISFDIPIPANYGGAIDVYYKLKSFHENGVGIILHCYQYDRKPSADLENLCEKVYYYPRKLNKTKLFSNKPYIVSTRNSTELLENLLKDNYPILFEGLHSCYYLDDERLKDRIKVVRTHNIEHDYYSSLARVEKNIFKRYYFHSEASKLSQFEEVLKHSTGIAAISKNDLHYFETKYDNVKQVSAFHPHDEVNCFTGKGEYALYHGSLEVGENNQAALYLVNEVFSGMDIKLVIAGNKASKELKEAVDQNPNIELKSSISTDEIYDLIKNAHVNILPTFQATGIKLKLLAALYMGRFCLVNTPMVSDTGLENLCVVRDKPDAIKMELEKLFLQEFQQLVIDKRRAVLKENGFSNSVNIEVLLKMLFN